MACNDPVGRNGVAGQPEPAEQRYVLRLYVSGMTRHSTRAVANIRRICETYLKGRYDLEVIDVYQHPEACSEDQVVAVPTVIKMLPEPLRQLIGDLSDRERVLAGLNIRPVLQKPNE